MSPKAKDSKPADATRVGSRRAGRADELIGARIRAARTGAGLTLEELSVRVGVSCQQLYKYESGANRITVSRLIEVADALEVDMEALLDLSHGGPTASGASGPGGQDVARLVSSFCAIRNSASRDKIMELADFLACFERSTQNPCND